MTYLIIDGVPDPCTKNMVMAWLLKNKRLKKRDVGRIELTRYRAQVELPADIAGTLVRTLNRAWFNGVIVEAWLRNDDAGSDDDGQLSRFLNLIELEKRAEADSLRREHSESHIHGRGDSSTSMGNLTIAGVKQGIGGRIFLSLKKRKPTKDIRSDHFRAGAPVLLIQQDAGDDGYRGVVSQSSAGYCEIVLDNFTEPEEPVTLYRIVPGGNEIAYRREFDALRRVRQAEGDRLAELRDILLGRKSFSFTDTPAIKPLDRTLNEGQMEAARFALSARDIGIVHGPPGTGKTTVVVEIIRQSIRQGLKVLACAPSNLGVDNIFERLLDHRETVARIGHPVRVHPELQEFCMDSLVDRHPDMGQATRLRKEAAKQFALADRLPASHDHREQRRTARQNARELLADARRLETGIVKSVLDAASVICATLHAVDIGVIGARKFDLLIIDEAGQSTEPACWIPIVRCDHVILAGDHCQLPPTVLSTEAAKQGLSTSLMERMVREHGGMISRRLTVQHRMHRDIMTFSSREFYDNDLSAHPSAACHRLADLNGVRNEELTAIAVHFIDTAGGEFGEEKAVDGESMCNRGEAELVHKKYREILKLGVYAGQVGIISPYSAQVRLLSELISQPQPEIATVDGFQGREKDVIIISLVRSNRHKNIGFLDDIRRMNVALTRARRKLIVIGDSSTITHHPFYNRMLEYFDDIGAYFGIWDENLATTS